MTTDEVKTLLRTIKNELSSKAQLSMVDQTERTYTIYAVITAEDMKKVLDKYIRKVGKKK